MSKPHKLIGQADGQHPKPGLPIFHIHIGNSRGNHARFYVRRRGPPLWCCLPPVRKRNRGLGRSFSKLSTTYRHLAGRVSGLIFIKLLEESLP
nr:MAG TPA: hypothetical protein [Caudoviricetes sp.]